MNKALLLIICDFLLISLLALARFDMEDPSESLRDQEVATQADPESDVLEMLKKSLEEEQRIRQEMDRELEQAQNQLANSKSQLTAQERARQEAERQLREKEEEARRLAAERAALQGALQTNRTELTQMQREYQDTRTNLVALQREYATAKASLETTREQFETTQRQLQETRRNFDATQSQIGVLNRELQDAQSQSRVNQQLVDQLQQDLSAQVQKAATMQQQMVQLDQQRESAVIQSEQLAGRLQVAQTESKLTREQLQDTKQQIAAVQQEKQVIQQEKAVIQERTTKLAEDVGTLAETSVEIKEEIRQSRPMTPNTIFNDFTSNRVYSAFQGVKPGIFGQASSKDTTSRTILFSQNGQTYAVYHLADTPLEFFAPAARWISFFLTLRQGQAIASIKQLRFVDREPRVILAPLTPEQVRELRVKVYPIAKDLFKFEEAVLVGTRESYYGECSFQIDPEAPGYMRMQRERFGRIFGKFVPSKGDLVFSKQGELIGVMANDDYCLVLENLQATRSVTLGNDIAREAFASQLEQMYFQVENKPSALR